MGGHQILRVADEAGQPLCKALHRTRIGPPRLNLFAHIGRATLAMFAEIGRVTLFLKDALLQGLTPKLFIRQILEQMMRIGYFSLPVVGLTAFFTGGALALQIYLGSSRFNAESLVAFERFKSSWYLTLL